MADLAVGLAKSVVEGALTKAQSAIEEDSRLRQSARRDLVFITGEFQMMQSFLKLADDERTRNIVVRTWVRQIRELAYDVEDCIEFVLHLDKKSHWWRRLLPSFIAAATQPLDEAIAEIRQLKARVGDVSSRNARYSLISDSGSKPAVVQQQPPAAARAAMGAAAFSMLVEATDIAKRQHGDLTQLITRKDDGLQESQGDREKAEEIPADKGGSQGDREKAEEIPAENGESQGDREKAEEILADNGGSKGDREKAEEISAENGESQGDRGKAEKIPAEHGVISATVPTSKTSAAKDWTEKYPIVGRESEMNELRQYTTFARFNSLQVISLWGIAGVGKSALARNLFCDRILHTQGLYGQYGWADVSHPFNLRDFSRSLLLDFHSESLQAKEASRHGTLRFKNPIQECRDFLEQHNCLVIIDDLQSQEEWDLIKTGLLSRSSKSIIIVITTEASIATCCADKEELVFNVKGLQADAAFDLFHKEAERKNSLSNLKNLKEEPKLKELIHKCGGLPEVIIAIAGVLAKKTVTLMDTVDSTNERFMHTLETNPEYDSLRGLFSWMYSYFRSCPDSLKPCIFYMSLFPRDHSTRRRRVVRRWVAESYSRDSEDKSAEQNGEKFFSNLLDLSIIQHPPQTASTASGDTRLMSCRVNGFIREYIVSRRMEENLVFELEGCCDVTTQRTGRHLIIRETWDRDKIVFESMDFSKLRSLTVFGKWKQFFVSDSMKLLRMLDLEDASEVEDADLRKMIKQLRRLKFLSLRGCIKIHYLPSSLGHLSQLQTLDIRHTSIVKLPASIAKLQKLQYIRAGTSHQAEQSSTPCLSVPELCRRHHLVGVMVPGRIDKLTALHTLGVVNIGASGAKAILKELKDLTQLRKLGVSGINKKNSKKFSSTISDYVHLESLSVQLDKGSQACLDDISLPVKNLRSLKLFGLLDKLPGEIKQLTKLAKLELEMDTLSQGDIAVLGDLPNLCTLRVKQLQGCNLRFCVEENGLEVRTYKKVKVFEIACSSSLDITFGKETMRSLEVLKAHCGNGSSARFSGLDNLTELKEVSLKGCCAEQLKEELRRQLSQHPKNPILKLDEEPRSS